MATKISNEELDSFIFPNHALNHILIKSKAVRGVARRILLKCETIKKQEVADLDFNFLDNFEKSANAFRDQGWAYVENIFPWSVHNQLVKNWPKFFHFNPVANIYKSYDLGFIEPETTFSRYPVFKQLFDYLMSDQLLRRIDAYAGDGIKDRDSGGFGISRARYGSTCINHLDSISKNSANKGAAINLILFVKGTGGSRSGGTCIYRDQYGKILFEPKNLTNTLLIYRSDVHHHGFPPMRFGAWRWMVSMHAQVRK